MKSLSDDAKAHLLRKYQKLTNVKLFKLLYDVYALESGD